MGAHDLRIIWQPLPGSQVSYITCPIYEALLEGTRGGGKTDTLIMDFAQHVGQGFGEHWRGVLFRLTYPQLADVVAKSKRWFYQIFPGIKFNESNYCWTWRTGEQLFFRYGASEDDYWNYHGHEYPWQGYEELTNWRDSTFFEAMDSTCRSSFPGMPRKRRATCNPFGKGHGWVKERYKLGTGGIPSGQVIRLDNEKPRVRIHSSIYENKILLANDPEYIKTLEALKDPNRRRAWLEGDWDIHVGSFLEQVWNPAKHIVTPFIIPSTWKVWKSMDWGYAAPYAVYWYAMDPDGCIYIWRELYGAGEKPGTGTREDAATVAKKIRRIEEHDERLGYEYRMNLADPAISANTGTANTIAKIFRDHGVKWQEAWNAKGSRVNGAQEIIRLLSEDKLKVFSTCKHWLRTVPSLPPDDSDPEDVDTDAEDHCFLPSTMVRTSMGDRRIDSIGDALVMNDCGEWVPFENWRITRRNADLVRVTFEDGHSVICTPDHKFMTGPDKYAEAKDLADTMCYAIKEISCASTLSAPPSKSSTASAITSAATTFKGKAFACIAWCGNRFMARFLPAPMSTMLMRIGPTINPITFNYSPSPTTSATTESRAKTGITAKSLEQKPQSNGMPAMPAKNGTSSTSISIAETRCTPKSSAHASSAAVSSWAGHSPNTATSTVPRKHSAAAIRVTKVEPAGKGDTGCITVMQRHNFALANGVIVSNSWDATRYGIMRRRRAPDEEQKSGDPEKGLYKDENDNHMLRV